MDHLLIQISQTLKKCAIKKKYYLDPTEELFLLALRSGKAARPNREYVAHLATYYGTVVSTTFISEWFKTRFNHKGFFCKPNLVPLYKFWQENVIRFIEYKLKCQLMFDHSCFCFIDKTSCQLRFGSKKTSMLPSLWLDGFYCRQRQF
jgi:hypothetical protein